MSREPAFADDEERTWQQPLAGRDSQRPPAERSTESDSHGAPARSVPPSDETSPELTAPHGDVTKLPDAPSDSHETPDSGGTQITPGSGSHEWDAAPPPTFEKGKVVFGKYRLMEKIGEGGMGEVWRVWHLGLESERALKLIKPEIAQNDKGWKRFQREAQLMAKINHPNAVAVFDFKRTQSMGYIEMEFIRGQSLTDIFKERHDQPMPPQWIGQILDQLCSVLQEAHEHQDEETGKPKPIIHRDLKPSNLMLVQRKNKDDPPKLKVLDFGIAKMVEDEKSVELTSPGDLVGTPAYMSPEQIKGGLEKDGQHRELDGRSDIYSTGVMLYHLLTGALPFRGSRMAMLAAHLNNPPLPMKEANPAANVPPEIERVVRQCLEKEADRRPQSARELAERYRRALGQAKPISGPAPARWKTWAIASAAVLVIGLIAAMIPLVPRVIGRSPLAGNRQPDTGRTETGKDGSTSPTSPNAKLWVPEGFLAVDADGTVADDPALPSRLKRKVGGVEFIHLRDGIYLPAAYKPDPDEPDSTVGGERWPRVIVSKSDPARRFIRIQGGTFPRGDPRPASSALDFDNQPLTPHWVTVPGYYIQETEVTNGEIEDYLNKHPDDERSLADWRELYERFQFDKKLKKEQARLYPAVRINYRMARVYAASVGGMLPTESEWEYAARSCRDTYCYAWGPDPLPRDQMKGNLWDPDAITPFQPLDVKSIGGDRTEQGVLGMVGNVREMCEDEANPYSAIHPDQHATRSTAYMDLRKPIDLSSNDSANGEIRIVVRGGSFQKTQAQAMAFLRGRMPANDTTDDVGFRAVIECPSHVR
jgi:serine/threonine-protein kinase